MNIMVILGRYVVKKYVFLILESPKIYYSPTSGILRFFIIYFFNLVFPD